MAARLINLEEGHPDVETAMMRLRLELATLRRVGVKTVKVIHGYGSSGKGGAIRQATHSYLSDQLRNRKLKGFCPGESFGPFESRGRKVMELAPDFRQDPDWGRQNEGITVIVL